MSLDADAEEARSDVLLASTGSSSDSSHESAASSIASPILVPTKEEKTAGEREYFCGVGKCRPKWMQIFRDAKVFTFILSLYAIIEGALVSGFTSVVLSTIERRYGFSSVWAGSIPSIFDASVLISVLFISYFGGRGHKPRWLGISLIVQGAGAFVFSLPQFIFGQYEEVDATNQSYALCEPSYVNSTQNCDSSTGMPALFFFYLGNILIGVGAAPLFTIGTTYMDDIVHPKYVTIHLGTFYAFSIIGPAIGYGLGGAFLSIYVDPWVETTLTTSDPKWVGAWWMCFILSGIISWLFAIPFLMFPKLLPDSSFVKQERAKEMAQKYEGKDVREEVDLATKVKMFPQHLKLVLKTPSWVFITIAVCFSYLIVSGVVAFAPKYLESQFSITASNASLLAGVIAVCGGGSGVFIGSLIIYFTKSKGRRVALINWVVTLVALSPLFVFIVNCPTLELVGVNVEYPDSSIISTSTSAINSSCFSHCNCDSSTSFEPVCGEDNFTYFSPCTAGCLNQVMDDSNMVTSFDNCTCIADRLMSNNSTVSSGTAVDMRCEQQCNKLEVFLAVIFLAILVIFVLEIPNIIITVRCVADEQRTLALGVQSFAFRLFGSIPGPLLFGGIFDSACIYWQNACNRRGNCWVYNNIHLSQRAVSLAMLGIATNFIFSLLSWLFYPKNEDSTSSKSETDAPSNEIELKTQTLNDKDHQSENDIVDSEM